MPDRIALKRLTLSDLTLFRTQYLNSERTGKQKAINLNSDILVDRLYPSLPDHAAAHNGEREIPLSLTIWGPGISTGHRVARKIVKNSAYKNWRLNGEFINDPDGEPGRYANLAAGDLAIMLFQGEPVPESIDIVLLASGDETDEAIHRRLDDLIPRSGRKSMLEVSKDNLSEKLNGLKISRDHPIQMLLADPQADAALEDAVQGDAEALSGLLRRRARPVSIDELNRAKANAARVGAEGEGLANNYLTQEKLSGRVSSFSWISKQNAVAPYDFEIHEPLSERKKIEIKSTEGEHSRAIHISGAEIAAAAQSDTPYSLYRVSRMTAAGGYMRIAHDIRPFARTLVNALRDLPLGVRPDAFSVDTTVFTWGEEILVIRPDEPEAATE